MIHIENTGYAVVLDTSVSEKFVYTAMLLFANGKTANYNVTSDTSSMKGDLVIYSSDDSDTLTLNKVSYNIMEQVSINKGERMLGAYYIADNVKIFNVVRYKSSTQITADLLNWEDIPNGTLPANKIWYTGSGGDFGDINVIYINDLYGDEYKTGIVQSASVTASEAGNIYDYTILIGDMQFKYNKALPNSDIGSLYSFKMTSSGIDIFSQLLRPYTTASLVQAIDSRRIKINSTIYYFKSGITAYYIDADGSVSNISLSDIDLLKSYSQVTVYPDDAIQSDGKVETIVMKGDGSRLPL